MEWFYIISFSLFISKISLAVLTRLENVYENYTIHEEPAMSVIVQLVLTYTIFLQVEVFIPDSNIVSDINSTTPEILRITSKPTAASVSNADMTIAITNAYGSQLSLSFGSNAGGPSPAGNPQPTVLPDASETHYTYPTGWAGRICIGPNLNPNGSMIEGSYTGPPNIDVSYVDGYSVPITCFSNEILVSGCNIDLFKQPEVTCDYQVDGPVCINSAKYIADGPPPAFFTACAGAAYTYPKDDHANASNLGNLISCCIGTSCKAPLRKISQEQ